MNKWESVKLIQYFCGKLDFVRSFHLRKLLFIKRIYLLVSHSVMTQCVNLYVLSKEFSDLKSLYAVDFMKMCSSGIRDVVYDAFADLCFGETRVGPSVSSLLLFKCLYWTFSL